ncbi:MAG: BON domain-containing protein [Steroidobacteraceae bacterium]|nr:BON domain-containing protein [Steroidobacteraceae bacterium]
MDHRWGQRLPVDIEVALEGPSGVRAIGRIRNVSVSGALIATRLTVAPLARIRVTTTPRFEAGTGETIAYVVRQTPFGLGIEWCELAPAPVRAMLAAATGGLRVGIEGTRVTLSGRVPSRSEREIAGEIAARAPGVTDVRNEICVGP